MELGANEVPAIEWERKSIKWWQRIGKRKKKKETNLRCHDRWEVVWQHSVGFRR